MPEFQIPSITSTQQAAEWVESFLKQILRLNPMDLRLDSRRSNSSGFIADALHVTELIDPCQRKSVYRLTGVAAENDQSDSAHWGHTGMLYEEWVRAAFRYAFPGRLKSNQMVPNLPEGVQGYYDLWWADTGILIDVKSRSLKLQEPMEKDRMQLRVYASHLKQKYDRPVYPVLVYTYREDLSQIDCYPVEYEFMKVLTDFKSSSQRQRQHINENTVPEIPEDFHHQRFPCSWFSANNERTFCSFYKRCWAEYALPSKPVPSPPEMQDMLEEYIDLAEKKKQSQNVVDAYDKLMDSIKQDMMPYFDAVGEYVEGPDTSQFDIKRIVVKPSETWDLKKAMAKISDLGQMLEPYKSERKGYTSLRLVKRKQSEE